MPHAVLLSAGLLDITVPSNGIVTNFVPELGIFDLPFLFNDRPHMYSVMDGPVGEQLSLVMREKGFRLLGFYEAGVRHIMTRTKPINSIGDLEALKIAYGEYIKGLEMSKAELMNLEPPFKYFDAPTYPLNKDKVSAAKAGIVGSVITGFLLVFFFIGRVEAKNIMAD